MADIHQLAEMFKKLDDQLVNCMRCGMCQAVCPLFRETGRETDVTRGKLALLEGLAAEILHDSQAIDTTLNRCLLCGTCQANCPSGVQIIDIFLSARAIMTGYFGLSPVKKAIFRGMLANPRLFNSLTSISSKFQGIFTRKVDDLLGSSCARFNAPVVADRHFNALATRPFRKIVPRLDTPAGSSGLRVAFFPGCVVDKMFPQIGEATIKILQKKEVGVYLPAGQACCGIPVLTSGDRQTFNTLVEMNVERFRGAAYDYLVTPCASCTSTIKELWPKLYSGNMDIEDDIAAIGDKTRDITEFLVDSCGIDEPGKPATGGDAITYHDPCHLKNALGITRQPRTLIRAAGGNFVEMNEAGTCCGCGGSFNVAHYELSKRIGNRKADNIVASGAKTVATGCPACMMQMTDMLSRRDQGVRVRHVVELYADSLQAKPQGNGKTAARKR
ncbi:MAG: (Fe-S)-binding protein [Desulfoprunum sp.]|jgi:glycolate oxidase iron-sulfur subunit|uniref:(Fe-S)-binding protein n=1 Tax=Desulfoprunum sp. TaxID=2020866 RepID=UPI00068B489A